MMKGVRWWLLGLVMLGLVACGTSGGQGETPEGGAEPSISAEATNAPEEEPEATGERVRLVTHDSFSVSEEVIAAFETAHNAEVVFVPLGDAGAMVNQSILSVNNPLGDVMFGVDNTFLTRALEAEIFEAYESPNLANVPDRFELDAEHRVTPVDYGDVCLNYDIAYFEEAGIAPPDALEALIEPEYAGLTVVAHPATSSPGLAFLLATVAHFGEAGWQPYWTALRANGVLVVSGWNEAYYDNFTAGGGEGTYPIVVSYASSPPFTGGTTASVVGDESCFRQVEFAGVLRNGANPELARALIDWMLTPAFQEDVPEQMFVFPVVEGTALPESFERWAQVPESPAEVEPAFIEANRDALIEEWTTIVLR